MGENHRHSRRDVLKYSVGGATVVIAGCAGNPLDGPGGAGTTTTGQGEFLDAAAEIDFQSGLRERRLPAMEQWPIEQRQDVPSRANDASWRGFEAFDTAPWEPPSGWEDTPAGDVDSIQVLNHGAANMEFDPATLATHELFEDRTGITVEPLEIGVDQANLKEQTILSARQSEPQVMNVDGPLAPLLIQ